MYALIKDNAVEAYPFFLNDLKKLHPNTSFPNKLSLVDPSFNVVEVLSTEQPSFDSVQGDLVEGTPVYEDNEWKQVWNFVKAADEIIQARQAQINSNLENEIRATRIVKLAQSDIDILRAYESGTSISDELKQYRQDLRDVPAQAGFPNNITWPTKP